MIANDVAPARSVTAIQIAMLNADVRLADLLRISGHMEAEGRLTEDLMMEVAHAEMEVDALRLMDEAGMTHPHEQVPFTPEELDGGFGRAEVRRRLPKAA